MISVVSRRKYKRTTSSNNRMSERRAYKFRLKPTTEQAESLRLFAGARRFIYNWALERRKLTYKARGKSVSWAGALGRVEGAQSPA